MVFHSGAMGAYGWLLEEDGGQVYKKSSFLRAFPPSACNVFMFRNFFLFVTN